MSATGRALIGLKSREVPARNDRAGTEISPARYLDTNVAFAVWVITGLPPFAVTVNGYVPFATERVTVTVRVVDDPLAGLGEKVPVTPAGRPLTDIVSGDVKPPVRVMVTL